MKINYVNREYFKPFEKIHTKGPYYKTVITTYMTFLVYFNRYSNVIVILMF